MDKVRTAKATAQVGGCSHGGRQGPREQSLSPGADSQPEEEPGPIVVPTDAKGTG